MVRSKASESWIKAGYFLFANEGLEGIHIERMARVLHLNKSGFYHYFGTLGIFLERLLVYHHDQIGRLINDIANSQNVDPDILQALARHKVAVMAQVQLTRNKRNLIFYQNSKAIDQKLDQAILPAWTKHIGILHNDDLAQRYCSYVRDRFYTRIDFENFNYDFLHSLATEAREIVEELLIEFTSLKEGVEPGDYRRARLELKT